MDTKIFDLKKNLKKLNEDKKRLKAPSTSNSEQPEKEISKRGPSQAEILIQIGENLQLFHDQKDEAFTIVCGEIMPVRSKRLKNYLSKIAWGNLNKAVNNESLNSALNVLEAKAIHENPQIELFTRIAKKDNNIWYDLGNNKAVKITAEGWKIVTPPILFKRYPHQIPQCEPIKGGDPYELFNFIPNITEQDQLLISATTISFLVPGIPHPILHIYGSQGSGKSFFFKIIKKLIDPSLIDVLMLTSDKKELIQALSHHYLCLFDNLTKLPEDVQNIFCQAVTGAGFSKRELFTNDDDVLYYIQRCIGLNGITLLTYKPDLMDRTLLLTLQRIEPKKMKEETHLWTDFEEAKPRMLGAFFTVLSKAMSLYPKIKLPYLYRLADYTRWAVAITEALGKDRWEFLKAYQHNVQKQSEEVIQNSMLAQSLIKFMNNQPETFITSTVGDLYNKLYDEVGQPNLSRDSTFPKASKDLIRYLERLKPNLQDIGISYKKENRTVEGVIINVQKDEKLHTLHTLPT